MSESGRKAKYSLPPARRLTGLVSPAAPPPRVPTKSWPADHSDRWSNDDRTAGLNHDHASVTVATTIRATMCAAAATFRGLSTESCETQQDDESRYRQDLSGHLPGYPLS